MRQQGTVKRLVSDRGFGFIQLAAGDDVFFHRSALVDGAFEDLIVGQSVTFMVGKGVKGPRAEKVQVGSL